MPRDNPFEPMIKNIGNYVSGGLYAQGVIPPIGINNYEGMALASPADVHLLAAKDPVIDEIAVGMSGSLIGENTVTGAPPLQLPNSAGYPLQGLEVALSPYQDLHGYDNPWPAGGGVNKLNANYTETFTTTKNFPVSLASGSTVWVYRDSFSYTVEPASGVKRPHAVFLDGSTVVGAVWVNPSGKTAGVTLTGDATILRIFANGYDWGASQDVEVTISGLEISYTEPSSWSPYSNICPIHGTDKLNIFVEESYDPAATPKAVIILNNTIYGGTYDAVSGLGVIDREMWLGSELTWEKVEGSQYRNFIATPSNAIVYSNTDITVISSHYKGTANNYATAVDDNYVWANSQQPLNRIAVKDTSKAALTADEFKAAVADVQFVCQLQTPIPFSTDGHSITLLQGNTTIWATSEDGSVDSMSASYIQNE